MPLVFKNQSFLFWEHFLDSYSPQFNCQLKGLRWASNRETLKWFQSLLKWFLSLRCRPPKCPNI